MKQVEIDGLFNARAAGDPAWLVRSGAPEAVTEAGAAQLRELGASVVIDLRESDEIGATAHGLPVRRIGLYGRPAPTVGRLESVYEALLRERAAALASAVGAIADADGAALVHCTAGKDRTGLVVALALAAAGAAQGEIEADYALSGDSVRPVREAIARRFADEADPADRAEILRLHLDSPVAAITHALDVIDELGGAVRYLLDAGLSPAQLDALRAKAGAATGRVLVEAAS